MTIQMYINSETDGDRLANELKVYLKYTGKPVVVEWGTNEVMREHHR